jgi:pimeloyl-ACP methyl ester carboxylesterase
MRTINLLLITCFVALNTRAMNNLEKININNSEQWVLVRGENVNAPLIIHVQAGPGLPMISEADAMGKLLGLEKHYLVAYWDKRGCGKSFNKNIDPKSITVSQLTDDIIECTKYLLKKYKKDKAILIGYSIGATTSLIAASKDSTLFSQLILVGIDIDIPKANAFALEFARSKALEQNNAKLLKQIDELGKKPIIDAKKLQERAKILTNMGGIKNGSTYNQLVISTLKNMLFSKAYSLGDIPRTIKGMEFSQNALLPEFDTFNLFKVVSSVKVPVHFFQGQLDAVAPPELAVSFYKYLQADTKTFTSFDNSAHAIPYEEPEKFVKTLNKILTTAKTMSYVH